jgi:hypothetical protein
MNKKERIKAFAALGRYILDNPSDLQEIIHKSFSYNSWFTIKNTQEALQNIASSFLKEQALEEWTQMYEIPDEPISKTVAIVAAGNIPMVAFHDILAVLIAGHRLQLKFSEKDRFLLPYILQQLQHIAPEFKDHITIVERLENFDAVIATGSNNSAQQFAFYFGKYKHIIRRNRNSIAILSGQETLEDLQHLGADVFNYFGLGCRNVAKLFIPKGYDLLQLKEGFMNYKDVDQHNQYMNNMDYQRTLCLMNQTPLVDIDFINILENKSLHSPISCLHYEYYESLEDVKASISEERDNLQCIVGNIPVEGALPFGKTQQPALSDYADNVDTMDFLLSLY